MDLFNITAVLLALLLLRDASVVCCGLVLRCSVVLMFLCYWSVVYMELSNVAA